jgi:hypothetical protein
MAPSDTEARVRIEVRDTDQNSKGVSFRDRYVLRIGKNQNVSCYQFYDTQSKPLEIKIESDELNLSSFPSRIASVMQKYADGDPLNWPTTYKNPVEEVDSTDVEIEVTEKKKQKPGWRFSGRENI